MHSARLVVVLVLGLPLGGCGEDVDPLVGTWKGRDASVSMTLIIGVDSTYGLTSVNELFPGMDKTETGTWRREGEDAFLRATHFKPPRPLAGPPSVADPTVDTCRLRIEQGVIVLETNDLYLFGGGAAAWAHPIRLHCTEN